MQPAFDADGAIRARTVCEAGLTVDHRVADGADAARAFGLLLAQATVVFGVNRKLGSNYLYLNGKLETPSLLDKLPPWPRYIPVAVAIGAACDFLTPIGHQCNTLVMGPGGYRFSDYARLGAPLSLLVILLAVPMILLVWPLK